jgi:hypothetical protein
MTGPSWLAYAFAGVMLATAVYCASRLAVSRWWRRPTERDVDLTHVFMGVAMAGMLVPRLNLVAARGWVAVFSLTSAWFGWQAVRACRSASAGGGRPGQHVPHLVASGAMLYMLLAVSGAGTGGAVHRTTAMSGAAAGAARLPTLALVFVLALLGYVIVTTDRLTSLQRVRAAAPAAPARQPATSGIMTGPADGAPRPDPAPPAGRPMSPRLSACCEIAMGITMGYVLILII